MQESLILHELLQKSDKILFLTHLAIGDFTYMQNYFKEFALKYPHLKIDLWVDASRGKNALSRWKSTHKDILYDWLKSCSFFNKIYTKTNSWWDLNSFFKEAKLQNYPIVVCLTEIRSHRFAKYARLIAPKGFVVGVVPPVKKYQLIKKYYFNRLNRSVNAKMPVLHVTHRYAYWFETLLDVKVDLEKRSPFVNIPKEWISFAKLKFLKWEITQKQRAYKKVIFINAFAKTNKRCWPIERVMELIALLKEQDVFCDTNFVINVTPDKYKFFEKGLKNYSLQKIFLFTVTHNFFQLPSIISLCDLVISVETSVIHLASALHVPVIALMRQKNLEWVPYNQEKSLVITTKTRNNWVKDIDVWTVASATKQFYDKICL